MKWVLGIGFVLVLVLGGLGLFLGPKIAEAIKNQKEGGLGTLVQVADAENSELKRIVSAPGAVAAKEQVNITSRVSAKILEIPVEAGDDVREGEVLARLDAKDLEAQLKASEARLLADRAGLKGAEASLASEEANIEGTRASLDRAVADWERQQELFASGDISKSDLDAARAEMDRLQAGYNAQRAGLRGVRANVEAAEARVAVAQADVDRAKENLEYATIRSPMDGVVTRIMMREGEVALGTISNAGQVIMTVADLSEMLVLTRIAEVDVARVREGQIAEIEINGYPEEVFEGTLRKLALQSQTSSDGTSNFDAEVVLHLDGRRIYSGLTANVDVQVETLEDILVVPSQAVLDLRVDELPKDIREGNEHVDSDRTFCQVVYTMSDGEAHVRPVRVAASNLQSTALTAGIDPGETVIVGPYRALQQLKDGGKVRVEEDEDEEDGDDSDGEGSGEDEEEGTKLAEDSDAGDGEGT